jgi:acetylglutamate kinase
LIINTLAEKGFIPVIAPVGAGKSGETYNINADLVACSIAMALSAGRLILLTDVDGVLDASGNLISSIDSAAIGKMVDDKIISGGMIPKIECSVKALNNGVEKVHIINGKKRHALLLELFTDKGIGTEVRK